MDSPQDLLEAICINPDDDAPRERFAKLIEPSDPPFAELIRLQLARARQERANGVVRSKPEGREAGLLGEHASRWSRYMNKFLVPGSEFYGDLGCRFERGFIAHARIAIENVVGLGERLYRFAPIQHLDVVEGEGDIRRLFSVPGLDRLDSLSLYRTKLGDAGAQALAACTALARATWMDLGSNDITLAGAFALAGSPMMQNKVVVSLDANPCNPVEEPYFDYDGTLVDISAKYPPSELERIVGHPVKWLHYEWKSPRDKPDRFHTRYVG